MTGKTRAAHRRIKLIGEIQKYIKLNAKLVKSRQVYKIELATGDINLIIRYLDDYRELLTDYAGQSVHEQENNPMHEHL